MSTLEEHVLVLPPSLELRAHVPSLYVRLLDAQLPSLLHLVSAVGLGVRDLIRVPVSKDELEEAARAVGLRLHPLSLATDSTHSHVRAAY